MPKPKKKGTIQIRVLPEEKTEWMEYVKIHRKEFPSLSQLIRFAVSEVIEKGITTTIRTNKEDLKTQIQQKNSGMKDLREETNRLLKALAEKREQNNRAMATTIEHDIKGKILKWITKFNGKLYSEDIAELINTPEPKTIEYLNKLIDQNLITHNKKMQYEVVNNE